MTKPIDARTNGNINLLLLADILEDADERHEAAREPSYDQMAWFHRCGTPACAIGHWLVYHGHRTQLVSREKLQQLQTGFDLDDKSWSRLFGYYPGHARSAREAAEKLRAFVAARAEVNGTPEHP